MNKTRFSGLTRLDPSDPLSVDNASFQSRNPEIEDRLLEIGAVTHRHDAHSALGNPSQESTPSGLVVPSGGNIPSDFSLSFGYTLNDTDGGETTLSGVGLISTGPQVNSPASDITASAGYDYGALVTATYHYGITFLDGEGGETALGPTVDAERAPGYASGHVLLSGLSADLGGTDAVAWALYRAMGGGDWTYLGSGSVDSFDDTGVECVDCSRRPPDDLNQTTNQANTLYVTVPTDDPAWARASSFNLYLTIDGDFGDAMFIGNFPLASGGVPIPITQLDFAAFTPPDVSTCIPGAHQIDPDSELLDWHWKRPVSARTALPSGAKGDVRLVTDDGDLWAVLVPTAASWTDWTPIVGGGGGGGSGTLKAVTDRDGHEVFDPAVLEVIGGSAVKARVFASGDTALVQLDTPFYASAAGGAEIGWGLLPETLRLKLDGFDMLVLDPADGRSDFYPTVSGDVGPATGQHKVVEFHGSGGTLVRVGSGADGHPVITISGGSSGGSGAVGPQGPAGAPGAQGPAGVGGVGSVTVAGSGAVPEFFGRSYLEFAGSAGIDVAVQDLGGSSARVLVSARTASGLRSVNANTSTFSNSGAAAVTSPADSVTFNMRKAGMVEIFAMLNLWNSTASQSQVGIWIDGVELTTEIGGGDFRGRVDNTSGSAQAVWTGPSVLDGNPVASGATAFQTSRAGVTDSIRHTVTTADPRSAGRPVSVWLEAGQHTVELRFRVVAGTGSTSQRTLIVVPPPDGGGGSGSGGVGSVTLTRSQATLLTGALASGWQASGVTGGSANVDVPLAHALIVYALKTDRPARVRAYAGSGQRAADGSRAIGVDPTGDHGVLLDFVTDPTDLDWTLSPMVVLANTESEPTRVGSVYVPMRVDNLGASGAVSATLTILPLES